MNQHRRAFIASQGSWIAAAGFVVAASACGAKAGQSRCDPAVETCVEATSTTSGAGGGATTGTGPTTSTTTSTGMGGTGAAGMAGKAGAGGSGGAPMMRNFTSRVVGYLPSWSGSLKNWTNDMPWYRVSHVDIAFLTTTPAGTLSFNPSQDMFLDGFVTAGHNTGAKILVSIGGAGAESTKIANLFVPATVDGFVSNIVAYLDAHHLDGIDVDVELDPVTANYGPFVDKLVAALRPKGKLVTAALAQWFAASIPAATYKQFDFVNVMSYDHCGSTPCEHSTYDAAMRDLDYFKNKGVATDRLVLGVPFYCQCWGATCPPPPYDYALALAKFPGGMDYIQSGGLTLSCNGPATILKKTMLAQSYGGVMAWQIAEDAAGDQALLKIIADNL